ncbi:MAG: hypothetical protein M1819_006627 [Sarea resinae]|nr:MAG: hypothetical protein M1819_006627 [Sarea resinae]
MENGGDPTVPVANLTTTTSITYSCPLTSCPSSPNSSVPPSRPSSSVPPNTHQLFKALRPLSLGPEGRIDSQREYGKPRTLPESPSLRPSLPRLEAAAASMNSHEETLPVSNSNPETRPDRPNGDQGACSSEDPPSSPLSTFTSSVFDLNDAEMESPHSSPGSTSSTQIANEPNEIIKVKPTTTWPRKRSKKGESIRLAQAAELQLPERFSERHALRTATKNSLDDLPPAVNSALAKPNSAPSLQCKLPAPARHKPVFPPKAKSSSKKQRKSRCEYHGHSSSRLISSVPWYSISPVILFVFLSLFWPPEISNYGSSNGFRE